MPGSASSAACWFVTSICSPPIAPSSILLASGLHSGIVYETRSNTTGRFMVTIVSVNDDPNRSDNDNRVSAISVVLLWDERQKVNPKEKLEFIHQRVLVLPMQFATSKAHQMLYDIDSDIKDSREYMNSLAKPTAK